MGKLFLLLALTATVAASTLWKVKEDGVKIEFEIPSESKTGSFSAIEAVLDFDPASPERSKLSAKVKVNTLSTNNPDMTAHLLSSDYFEADKYPFITFESSSVSKTDSGYIAKGQLTMKERSRPVEIPFVFIDNNRGAFFKGSMSILCGDFGILSNKENNPRTRTNITILVPVTKK